MKTWKVLINPGVMTYEVFSADEEEARYIALTKLIDDLEKSWNGESDLDVEYNVQEVET